MDTSEDMPVRVMGPIRALDLLNVTGSVQILCVMTAIRQMLQGPQKGYWPCCIIKIAVLAISCNVAQQLLVHSCMHAEMLKHKLWSQGCVCMLSLLTNCHASDLILVHVTKLTNVIGRFCLEEVDSCGFNLSREHALLQPTSLPVVFLVRVHSQMCRVLTVQVAPLIMVRLTV